MAPVLPIGGSGDFGTSPFLGQLADKTLLDRSWAHGVPGVQNNAGQKINSRSRWLPLWSRRSEWDANDGEMVGAGNGDSCGEFLPGGTEPLGGALSYSCNQSHW